MEPKFKLTKRKVAVAGAVALAVVVGTIALRKPHASAPGASGESSTGETAGGAGTLKPAIPGATATTMSTVRSAMPDPLAANYGTPPPPATTMPAMPTMGDGPSSMPPMPGDDSSGKDPKGKKKHGKVMPFGNGPVAHGNVLHVKMDGTIDKIEGAQQPTGFTVRIPGCRSLEAAGPLAQRDSRIAAIRVSNDPAGAELAVTFKDTVPNYQVRAKNDMLEIALAPIGKTVAKKDTHGGQKAHHVSTGKKPHKGADKQ